MGAEREGPFLALEFNLESHLAVTILSDVRIAPQLQCKALAPRSPTPLRGLRAPSLLF